MKKPEIFVTGDLIVDRDVLHLPEDRTDYRTACTHAVQMEARGGAWLLADILRKLEAGAIESPQHGDKHAVARALSLWELKPKTRNAKERCWRVAEFIGCERPEGEILSEQFWPDKSAAKIVVIDDLGSFFAEQEELWKSERARQCMGNADDIVCKASSLASPMMEHLLASEFSRKLTLIVPVQALREAGARISRALSWDAAVEDLKREMRSGRIGGMLAGCKRLVVLFAAEGAATFGRDPRNSDEEGDDARNLHFEQFVFDPVNLEGVVFARTPGRIYGSMSILTAAIAANCADADRFPRFAMICRALKAVQKMEFDGAGSGAGGPQGLSVRVEKVARLLDDPGSLSSGSRPLPEDEFGTAFPRELLDRGDDADSGVESLLTDATGNHPVLINAKAEEIVLRGPAKAMALIPCAKYGHYTTYDRDEIERINSLRSLISDYLQGRQSKPLSIAVFGQPGAGKSFAIKQLAKELFPDGDQELTFNLSQFESLQDLHDAFHIVRDKTLTGNMPLVFWDEFDSTHQGEKLHWLKNFLAPMQDGEFTEHGRNHPLGRAIFVFAGATTHSFAQFMEQSTDNRDAKAPDFISRLRGYVDIKGPNPVSADDRQYAIRRALLIRSFIARLAPSLLEGDGVASISPGVRKGLLFVDKYQHGARSLESVISQSHLSGIYHYGPSELPPPQLLDIHVSDDFIRLVDDGERGSLLGAGFIDELARRLHEAWRRNKESDGWTYGEERDNRSKKNPLLKAYEELDDAGRENNLRPAREALTRLERLGIRAIPSSELYRDRYEVIEDIAEEERRAMARIEHGRWMRERLRRGYVYGPVQNDAARLHNNIDRFDKLSEEDSQLDSHQIETTLEMLAERGMVLVRDLEIEPGKNQEEEGGE